MAGQGRRCEARPKQSGRKISSLPPINRKLKWARMPFAIHLPHDGRADIQPRERRVPQLVVCGPIRRPHRLLLALQGRREGRSPDESLEAIQPGLAERGVITRTGPLYDRVYLTEQRTTSHSDARSSLCFTRFLLLAIRNRLVDKLVECCALLGGADGSHDWIPYDVAILIDDIRCREREQI